MSGSRSGWERLRRRVDLLSQEPEIHLRRGLRLAACSLSLIFCSCAVPQAGVDRPLEADPSQEQNEVAEAAPAPAAHYFPDLPPRHARVTLLAPERVATGDPICFGLLATNIGDEVMTATFAGGANRAAIDIIVTGERGDTVWRLSRGDPPPLAGIRRDIAPGEGIVVWRAWDQHVRTRDIAHGDLLKPGTYQARGYFPSSPYQGKISSAVRIRIEDELAPGEAVRPLPCPAPSEPPGRLREAG